MIRALTILAAIAALAVAAAPASAGASQKRPLPGVMLQHGDFSSILYNGHAGLGANASTRILSMDHNI